MSAAGVASTAAAPAPMRLAAYAGEPFAVVAMTLRFRPPASFTSFGEAFRMTTPAPSGKTSACSASSPAKTGTVVNARIRFSSSRTAGPSVRSRTTRAARDPSASMTPCASSAATLRAIGPGLPSRTLRASSTEPLEIGPISRRPAPRAGKALAAFLAESMLTVAPTGEANLTPLKVVEASGGGDV